MRMAPNKLIANAFDHILKAECPPLTCHMGVHDDVKQQVAQFFSQIRVIRLLDRLNGLVALFNEGSAQGQLANLLTSLGQGLAGFAEQENVVHW